MASTGHMTDTLIRHLVCGEPIFVVRGGIRPGELLPPASAFEPLNPEWPQPRAGDETRCPNCGAGFGMHDGDLQRTDVDAW